MLKKCFHKRLLCISPKPQTGTKRPLEAVEASEEVKPELPVKDIEEMEPKKLTIKESPTKVAGKPDKGTT